MKRILIVSLLFAAFAVIALTMYNRLPVSVARQNVQPQRGSAKGITPTPLTADYEMEETRTLADGNVLKKAVTGKYYRDSQGRVRREQSGLITITDPLIGTSYILDQKTKTARKMLRPDTPPSSADGSVTRSPQAAGEQRALGERTIAGVTAAGKEYISVIPADSKIGNREPIEVTFQVWTADAIQLPVLTSVADPVNGDRIQRYSNIQAGAEPAAELFQIPNDFQVIEVGPARRN